MSQDSTGQDGTHRDLFGEDILGQAKIMETKLALPVQSKFSEEVAEWIEAFDDLVVGEGPVQGAELIAAFKAFQGKAWKIPVIGNIATKMAMK